MLLEIQPAAWEALNDLYAEDVSERLTTLLNENNPSSLCHDFEVHKVHFGSPPLLHYANGCLHLDYSEASLELDVILGISEASPEFDSNFDLLSGLLSTLTHSIQLPLHLCIILQFLSICINLEGGNAQVQRVQVEVEGEIAGSASAWVRERVKRELEGRIRQIVSELDLKDLLHNWPLLLTTSKRTKQGIARTVKSFKSKITFK